MSKNGKVQFDYTGKELKHRGIMELLNIAGEEVRAYRKEREELVRVIREMCDLFGDNEWESRDALHLVLRNHLLKYMREELKMNYSHFVQRRDRLR